MFVGTESRPHKKDKKRKKVRKLVSLTVPGTKEKSNSVPDVIQICQETHKKKTPRKKVKYLSLVTVPDMSKLEEKRNSISDCIPSIKRCTPEEINAINRQCGGRKKRKKTSTKTQRNTMETHSNHQSLNTHVAIHTEVPDFVHFNSIFIFRNVCR